MPKYSLTGKVALVTGGGTGLGAATDERLARNGARVVIGDLDGPAAGRVANRLSCAQSLGLQCDVTDLASVTAVVDRVRDDFGRIDVTIANAGILGPSTTVRAQSPGSMASVMAVNVTGVINTVTATVGSIIENRGQVVMISSVFAFVNGAGSRREAAESDRVRVERPDSVGRPVAEPISATTFRLVTPKRWPDSVRRAP